MKKSKKVFGISGCHSAPIRKKTKKSEKKFWQFGKWLYFCTRFRPENGMLKKGKRKDIEKVETRDSVCRRSCLGAGLRTRRVKGKNKRRNSYNEEFDPG
ncbi:MAG: hypothetical protein IJK99_08740, partial [Bacteroidales bacterium]|nr:hypothetical protein [Bacteroidales bacterium]